jgi:hypothetical protein
MPRRRLLLDGDCITMLSELPDDGRRADYALELTEKEAEALKAAVKDADGRKSEVKLARKVLGV